MPTINYYQRIHTPCITKEKQTSIAIRSYERDGEPYFVVVNPITFKTSCEPQKEVLFRKVLRTPQDIGYYTRQELDVTPYHHALSQCLTPPFLIENYGIRHSMRHHDQQEVFLTVDLCPSNKPFEREFFEAIASSDTPFPLTIFITSGWLLHHKEDFMWLVNQQKENKLDIIWANHSASHVYYHDRNSSEGLQENFLLDPRTNLSYELLTIERMLLEQDQIPSVFFRAPGLITNEPLMRELDQYGLITLGADAWLAKGEEPQAGSIILVHGNSNEPLGIERFMKIWRENKFKFCSLDQAFLTSLEVQEQFQNQANRSSDITKSTDLICPCCPPAQTSMSGYDTDEDALKILAQDTTEYGLTKAQWNKNKSLQKQSGQRQLTNNHFSTVNERIGFFKYLKRKLHEVEQHENIEGDIDLVVNIPTIKRMTYKK